MWMEITTSRNLASAKYEEKERQTLQSFMRKNIFLLFKKYFWGSFAEHTVAAISQL